MELSEDELNRAYNRLAYYANRLNRFERVLLAVIYWSAGDRLLALIADERNSVKMQTLHRASHGIYADWFKEQRIKRKHIAAQAKNWVRATVVE